MTGTELWRNGRWPQDWPAERVPLLLETSVPRVFAAGDVRRGAVRRVTSAIMEGMLAITLARHVLREQAQSPVGAAS
jgi:thioredoxin reductase (NADPH)